MHSTIAISQERVVFDGPLGKLRRHSHAVLALLVGMDANFELITHDDRQEVRFAAVPAAVEHELDFRGSRVLVIYVEAHDPGYASFHRAARSRCRTETRLDRALGEALQAWTERAQVEPVLAATRELLDVLPSEIDPRITRIATSFNDGDLLDADADAIARSVGLSTSRLLHLFKSELGVGIRRLKQHYRFKQAVAIVADGGSFTAAAHHAGFADSAHFSRAFSETFGLSPASVLIKSVRWRMGNG